MEFVDGEAEEREADAKERGEEEPDEEGFFPRFVVTVKGGADAGEGDEAADIACERAFGEFDTVFADGDGNGGVDS